MRIWSLHPCYLDAKGLTAVWREALLAQKVLRGETRGYRLHPQLERFKSQIDPLGAIGTYLLPVWQEAANRGYSFNREKIDREYPVPLIPVTLGQLHHEWKHLLGKLERRDPGRYQEMVRLHVPEVHPLFRLVPGEIEEWERIERE
jgi:Pyrimidine dimer DNA glycosylase